MSADSTDSKWSHLTKRLLLVRDSLFFHRDKPFFRLDPSRGRKPAKRTIRPNNPVTRNNDRDRVAGKCLRHSPGGLWTPNLNCELAIGHCVAVRDGTTFLQNSLSKSGTFPQINWNVRQVKPSARKIIPDSLNQVFALWPQLPARGNDEGFAGRQVALYDSFTRCSVVHPCWRRIIAICVSTPQPLITLGFELADQNVLICLTDMATDDTPVPQDEPDRVDRRPCPQDQCNHPRMIRLHTLTNLRAETHMVNERQMRQVVNPEYV